MTVPPGAGDVPDDAEAAAEYAAAPPGPGGSPHRGRRACAPARRWCAIRQRAHDEDDMVLTGHDLVPALLELLHATLEPDAGEPTNDERR